MKRSVITVLGTLLAVASSLLPASAERSGRPEHASEHFERLARESITPMTARVDDDGKVVALRGRFPGDDGRDEVQDAGTSARNFLMRHAAILGLRPDLGDLTLARRTDDRGGAVVRFEQRHQGLPVDGGTVVVGLDPSGHVIHLVNAHVPHLDDVETAPRLQASEALARAEEALGGPLHILHEPAALTIAAGGKGHPGHRLAWRIHGAAAQPRGEWLVFVDARTGDVIRTHDLIRETGAPCVPCNPAIDPACGRIFFYNPVVVLDNPALSDGSNVDAAQTGCFLPNLTSATLLDGLYASTSLTSSRATAPWSSLRSVSQGAVDEVNVYYHMDRAKGYLTQMGFPAVMNFSIDADARKTSLGDNAHYVPATKIIEFGTGGVDDAQDPDVIYHEYGHAIQDNQVPGFGQSIEAGAMGEGFGDFWASSLMDGMAATALGAACVAEWDATAYNPFNGGFGTGCLRRLDGIKQYPRDQVFQVHDDGEIWSSALWLLRQAVGGPVADPVVVRSHSFLTTNADFTDGADALLAADVSLHGGNHAAAIDAAMAARGIPRSALPAPPQGLTQTLPFVCETAHNYLNLEFKECRLTVPGATRIRFHFTRVGTEDGFDFLRISDPAFRQVQVLSGTPSSGNPFSGAAVYGDTIVARFKADPSVRTYGFRIDAVEYATGAGQVPDGDNVQGTPLMVTHAPGNAVALTWGASCGGGNDYAIYEGTLGDYSSHVPVTCSTGGATSSTFIPPGHSTYYLVVPVVPGAEGSYGQKSDGTERPASVSSCRPQQILDSCS